MAHEKRIYLRQLNPNPLFTSWLEEWQNLAKKKGSLKKHSLAKALESIRKYPLVLYTGRDCSILDGFGQTICRMLDKRLEEHKKNIINFDVLNEHEHNKSVQTFLKNVQFEIGQRSAKKQLLTTVGTHKNTNTDDLEDSIMKLFKKYDDIDTEGPPNLSILLSDVAIEDENTKNKNVIEVGTFEIILLVDTQETIGKSKRSLDATIKALKTNNVKFEVRHLSVGDFVWIARCQNEDYVLPYIVERKRMDDLASSIRDGRFHEQKFRLQDCGIGNIIYMIENRGNNLHLGIPLSSLLQAATNTQVQNDFTVKFTDSHEDSMIYLSVMTKLLAQTYDTKPLKFFGMNEIKLLLKSEEREQAVIKFTEFNEKMVKIKNFKISQLFLRQLLQLKTLSLDKAVAILNVYPTPVALFSAYEQLQNDQQKCELLLAKIEYGNLQKQIGSAISKCIYHYYYTEESS